MPARPRSNAPRVPDQPVPDDELKTACDEAVVDARSLLEQMMDEAGVNHYMLAERLGVTRPNITQVLARGSGNPTIRTMAAWASAMGYRLVLDFEPLTADDNDLET